MTVRGSLPQTWESGSYRAVVKKTPALPVFKASGSVFEWGEELLHGKRIKITMEVEDRP